MRPLNDGYHLLLLFPTCDARFFCQLETEVGHLAPNPAQPHGSYKLNPHNSGPSIATISKLPFPPPVTSLARLDAHTSEGDNQGPCCHGVQLDQAGLFVVVRVDAGGGQDVRARPGGVRHGHPGPVAQRGALHGRHQVRRGGAPPLPAARPRRRADRVRRGAVPLVRRRAAAADAAAR